MFSSLRCSPKLSACVPICRQIHLHVDVGACGARIVEFRRTEAGLQLFDVVECVAHRGAHAEAFRAPVFDFRSNTTLFSKSCEAGAYGGSLECLRGIFRAAAGLPAARAKLQRVGRREFGEARPVTLR